jgi:[ribosomal protein S5]-alanine N-acetyltransferase
LIKSVCKREFNKLAQIEYAQNSVPSLIPIHLMMVLVVLKMLLPCQLMIPIYTIHHKLANQVSHFFFSFIYFYPMQFTLRPILSSDLESFAAYANNFNIAKNLTNAFPHPYTLEKAKAFLEIMEKQSPRNVLGIDIDGAICGAIGIHFQTDVYEKNAEMGYWLAEPFWGKGIMSKAIPQMVEYAFANFSIERIYARPFGHNIASQMALKKAGFTLEAVLKDTFYKNGETLDEWIFAIRRDQKK